MKPAKLTDKLTEEEKKQLNWFRIEQSIITLKNVYARNKGDKLITKKKRRKKAKQAKKSRAKNR